MASRSNVVGVPQVAMIVGMVGVTYASVPLYRMFCQVLPDLLSSHAMALARRSLNATLGDSSHLIRTRRLPATEAPLRRAGYVSCP